MDMRTLNIIGVTGVEFTAVWDRAANEVMFYDTRFTGDAERGARRQDQWTPDGQFVSSYSALDLSHHGNYGLNMYGGEPEWTLSASALTQVTKWLRC